MVLLFFRFVRLFARSFLFLLLVCVFPFVVAPLLVFSISLCVFKVPFFRASRSHAKQVYVGAPFSLMLAPLGALGRHLGSSWRS